MVAAHVWYVRGRGSLMEKLEREDQDQSGLATGMGYGETRIWVFDAWMSRGRGSRSPVVSSDGLMIPALAVTAGWIWIWIVQIDQWLFSGSLAAGGAVIAMCTRLSGTLDEASSRGDTDPNVVSPNMLSQSP